MTTKKSEPSRFEKYGEISGTVDVIMSSLLEKLVYEDFTKHFDLEQARDEIDKDMNRIYVFGSIAKRKSFFNLVAKDSQDDQYTQGDYGGDIAKTFLHGIAQRLMINEPEAFFDSKKQFGIGYIDQTGVPCALGFYSFEDEKGNINFVLINIRDLNKPKKERQMTLYSSEGSYADILKSKFHRDEADSETKGEEAIIERLTEIPHVRPVSFDEMHLNFLNSLNQPKLAEVVASIFSAEHKQIELMAGGYQDEEILPVEFTLPVINPRQPQIKYEYNQAVYQLTSGILLQKNLADLNVLTEAKIEFGERISDDEKKSIMLNSWRLLIKTVLTALPQETSSKYTKWLTDYWKSAVKVVTEDFNKLMLGPEPPKVEDVKKILDEMVKSKQPDLVYIAKISRKALVDDMVNFEFVANSKFDVINAPSPPTPPS